MLNRINPSGIEKYMPVLKDLEESGNKILVPSPLYVANINAYPVIKVENSLLELLFC